MNTATRELRDLDKAHLWHPFTAMRDWGAPGHDPLVIERGEGAWLVDTEGNRYLDGNSSIWTNIHGHNHPVINAAVRAQLEKIAHCSALGFTNEPAIRLAAALTALFPPDTLTRVFYTDDGSTAVECACKMALQYFQLTGRPERRRFAAFDRAYHGDTAGAASLGGIATFHDRFRRDGFEVARLGGLDDLLALPESETKTLAALAIEPLVQGAAGMRLWPPGMLRELRDWCDRRGVLLIFDEVLTGFGRTGKLFACRHEGVWPDFLALAKGLSGGYLPLAATLTTEEVFSAFLGAPEEGKTFYYGHSYCGNPLGCAAALASLSLFGPDPTGFGLGPNPVGLKNALESRFGDHPKVAAIRQIGLIAAIDLVRDRATGEAFPAADGVGARVCLAARKHGLLTRPILDTLVFLPPLCVTAEEIELGVEALARAVAEVL
ncbi:MAG: adenosylmethionine--8-amino-7-oxononanoate transaminase [Verrucomicrobiae bacterium]|nr:adenosylmethionine--8-amino-7-oxononanoate transaminase [Verrucomicrobiae bacterium]